MVSHASAAAVHGLTLWNVPLDRVHVTRNRRSGGRRTTLLHVHTVGLDADEVVEVDGIAVTSVPRTLADLARTLPLEPALVVADAALHRHRATPAAFEEAVARAAAAGQSTGASGRRRRRPARRERRRDTQPGGDGAGRPPAGGLQHEVPGLRAVTDFYWEEFRTVGEFDGKVKYGRSLRPGEDPGEAVYREKRREDALRDLGLKVVRWTWDELGTFIAPAESPAPGVRRA